MERVEEKSDADITEVRASAADFEDVQLRTEPLRRFLDFWHALKWVDSSVQENKALQALFDGHFGEPLQVAAGLKPPFRRPDLRAKMRSFSGWKRISWRSPERVSLQFRDYVALRGLLTKAHALAAEQHFLHWQIAFPGVWRNWISAEPEGGFDAVIGNPPWDRMKMQEVEWFAARAPQVARQARAADRKAMIAKMEQAGDPLIDLYERASGLAERAMTLARRGGDYPLLSRGDINIYSLFVERAQALIKPDGIAGLLVPSGIASDFGASAFFRKVATAGRVQCLFDFENRRGEGRELFFPDVDSRFKFCVFVCGGSKGSGPATDCAFFLRDPPAVVSNDRQFTLSAADFALVNPNTGTTPIFRTKRDAELTTAIYRRLPVLVDRSTGVEKKAWPVQYLTMFHMTNDSHLFWSRERLEKDGAYPSGLSGWCKGKKEWLPLYEGKMVQAFDHRAADVLVNLANIHRPAQPEPLDHEAHGNPKRLLSPQYWVERESTLAFAIPNTPVGFKEVTAPTNERSMIAAFLPQAGYGNTIPVLYGATQDRLALWLACLNAFVFDYCARSKIQGQHLNWYIVEQLPVLTPEHYARCFGKRTAEEIVKDHVLRLTYTAHDMVRRLRATWATLKRTARRSRRSSGTRRSGGGCGRGSTRFTSSCTGSPMRTTSATSSRRFPSSSARTARPSRTSTSPAS